jgi:tryptophan synthase alpha chain
MRLDEKIKQVNDAGSGIHMPHIYVGDPNIEFSEALIETLATNGGDIVEVGIPFSDPVADGGTFQGVCERALANGTTPTDCLDLIKRFTSTYSNPLVLTTYYNIPYSMGIPEFIRRAKEVGVNGLIIPNMPVEEASLVLEETRKNDIDERLKKIVAVAKGFLYVTNVEGVTGTRSIVQKSTVKLLERTRNHTDLPLLAGFGVSTGEHARILTQAGADGVIAGSVYANIYSSKENPWTSLSTVAEKVKEIKSGCR